MKTLFFTLLTLLFTSSLFSQSLENGLVAKYSFDKTDYQNERAMDLTDNNNDITCNQISFFDDDPSGNSDAAMATAYPVPEAYMELNENTDLISINELSDFTISFWTIQGYFTSGLPGFSPILNIEDDNGTAINIELNIETKEVHLTYKDGVVNETVHNSNADIPISGWYHVSMTVNQIQNQLTLYIDGEWIGQIDLTSISALINPVITFGKYRNGDHAYRTTCFDEMYIHNRIISQEEIILTREDLFTTSENNILPAEDLKIYPNPAKDISILNVEFPNATSKTLVEIYDVQGRVVQTEKMNNNQINIAQLSKGVYLFKVKTTEGVFMKKIMIE